MNWLSDKHFIEKGYYISADKKLMDIDFIHHFLAYESYWAPGISRNIVQRSIDHSLCFGVFTKHGQVGFARAITDEATFAYLADVFITEKHRKTGLAKWLVQTMLAHESLQNLRRIMLVTADAQSLYTRFGFKQIEQPERYLALKRNDTGGTMPA